MSRTVSLDLPHEYWKDLRALGVSRDPENSKGVMVSFTRGLSDDELRRLHEFLRGFKNTQPSDEAAAAAAFSAWLNDGPKLAAAAGCHVGIKVTEAKRGH